MSDKKIYVHVKWNIFMVGVAVHKDIKSVSVFLGPVVIDFDYGLL